MLADVSVADIVKGQNSTPCLLRNMVEIVDVFGPLLQVICGGAFIGVSNFL